MEYRISNDGGRIAISISGRLTFSDAATFPKVLAEIARPGVTACEFDMAALEFIDSTGMSLLVHAYDQSKVGGFKVTLRNSRGSVRSSLERAGFPALFEMA